MLPDHSSIKPSMMSVSNENLPSTPLSTIEYHDDDVSLTQDYEGHGDFPDCRTDSMFAPCRHRKAHDIRRRHRRAAASVYSTLSHSSLFALEEGLLARKRNYVSNGIINQSRALAARAREMPPMGTWSRMSLRNAYLADKRDLTNKVRMAEQHDLLTEDAQETYRDFLLVDVAEEERALRAEERLFAERGQFAAHPPRAMSYSTIQITNWNKNQSLLENLRPPGMAEPPLYTYLTEWPLHPLQEFTESHLRPVQAFVTTPPSANISVVTPAPVATVTQDDTSHNAPRRRVSTTRSGISLRRVATQPAVVSIRARLDGPRPATGHRLDRTTSLRNWIELSVIEERSSRQTSRQSSSRPQGSSIQTRNETGSISSLLTEWPFSSQNGDQGHGDTS